MGPGKGESASNGQEANSIHKPAEKRPENIFEAGYKCMCLNARSLVNKEN